MQKFNKKQVDVYAVRWNGNIKPMQDFIGDCEYLIKGDKFYIFSIDGVLQVNAGEWVIKEEGMNIYTATNEIFKRYYEKDVFVGTHRHYKCGSVYKITGHSRLQLEGEHNGQEIIHYEDEEGNKWSRLTYEFFDGRFVEIK